MDTGIFIDQTFAGLGRGALLFLIASGMTLIFGVLHVLNFAHGAIYLFGAYMCFAFTTTFAKTPGNFWMALVVAPVATAMIGGLIEMGLLRRVYKKAHLYQFLLMFAVVYVLTDIMRLIWGVQYRMVSRPTIIAHSVLIFDRSIPTYSLFSIGVAVIVAFIIWFILYRTRFGRNVRAVAQDGEMAASLGIDTSMVHTAVYCIGAWMAGIGGVVLAGFGSFGYGVDAEAVILAFVIVCVGGMGSLTGAILGAVLIGFAEAFGMLILPALSLIFVYLIMAIVLIFRPWGLMGRPQV